MSDMMWDKNTGSWVARQSGTHGEDVSARTNTRAFYNCRDDEELYTWLAEYTCAANDYALYIKNTNSTKDLYIDNISLSTSANSLFYLVNAIGAATGTAVTGRNLNISSTNTPTGSFLRKAAGGVSNGGKLKARRIAANSSGDLGLKGCIILKDGDAIAVISQSVATIEITITGYYE